MNQCHRSQFLYRLTGDDFKPRLSRWGWVIALIIIAALATALTGGLWK